jgi:Subtilase family
MFTSKNISKSIFNSASSEDLSSNSFDFNTQNNERPEQFTDTTSDNFEILRAGGGSRFANYTPPSNTKSTSTTNNTTTTLPTVPSTLSISAEKQTVVILDTGIGSNINNVIYQYDFYANDTNASNSTSSNHGSIVASQVLAADPNVNIIMLKVAADNSDSISLTAVDSALDWVAANATLLNIAAVNLSFGGSSTTTTATTTSLSDEFLTLKNLDVAVVVAAGNSGVKTGISDLASDSNVIAVSASDGLGNFASFSNRDVDLTDLVADGVGISTGTSTVSGTSFSAPLVAGAISEVKSVFYDTYGRELTVSEALLLLQKTADSMNTSGETAGNGSYGSGYVELDLSDAINAIHSTTELALIGISV